MQIFAVGVLISLLITFPDNWGVVFKSRVADPDQIFEKKPDSDPNLTVYKKNGSESAFQEKPEKNSNPDPT